MSFRVDNFKFPQIYLKFKAKDADSEAIVTYIVQDLPEDRFDDAVQFMVEHFIPDEANCEYLGLGKNPASVKNASDSWRKMLDEKLTLVCFKENSSEIVGLNIMVMYKKDTTLDDFGITDPLWKEIFAIGTVARQKFCYFDYHKVDKYVKGFGLAVNTKYRARGIATEILKARIPLLKTLKDVKVTANGFASNGSVMAARRAGYQEHLMIPYSEMHKLSENLKFPGMKHDCYTAMSYKID